MGCNWFVLFSSVHFFLNFPKGCEGGIHTVGEGPTAYFLTG